MTSTKNTRTYASRNIDLQFDTRDMVPFYTKLVEGVYSRPVVVTFLFPRSYCRKLNATSPSSKSRASVNVADNATENNSSDHLINSVDNDDSDLMSVDKNQHKIEEVIRRAKISKHFVVTVSDVVQSRDASYKVIIRDFKDLLKEIKQDYENSPSVDDYFKPGSVRWWISYIEQVLLVFDRPSGKLGVLVDKGKIIQRIRNKMDHHIWMLNKLSTEEQPSSLHHHDVVNDEKPQMTTGAADLVEQFESYQDESIILGSDDLLEKSTNLDQSVEEQVTHEDVIEDHAIVGMDESKTERFDDRQPAREVPDDIDESASIRVDGSVTGNILNDGSSVSNDLGMESVLDNSESPEEHVEVIFEKEKKNNSTPVKRQPQSASKKHNSSHKIDKKINEKKLHKTGDEPGHQRKNKQSSNRDEHCDNSITLPAIVPPGGHENQKRRSSPTQSHSKASPASSAPALPVSAKQGRTNQLLEDAYGVAATSILFPAKYAQEEERLKQSILASLPGSKAAARKRAATAAAAGGSMNSAAPNSAGGRSHREGKLPAIHNKRTVDIAVIHQDVVDVSVVRTEDSMYSVEGGDDGREGDNHDEEYATMTLTEIAMQVADSVNREIDFDRHSHHEDSSKMAMNVETTLFTSHSAPNTLTHNESFSPIDDSQIDVYRQVAVATEFLSIHRSVSPQPRPESPFAEEFKHLRGSKKIAAELIRKARKSVSGNSKFQVRKISISEKKLLDSPFAKRMWVDPPPAQDAANQSKSNTAGTNTTDHHHHHIDSSSIDHDDHGHHHSRVEVEAGVLESNNKKIVSSPPRSENRSHSPSHSHHSPSHSRSNASSSRQHRISSGSPAAGKFKPKHKTVTTPTETTHHHTAVVKGHKSSQQQSTSSVSTSLMNKEQTKSSVVNESEGGQEKTAESNSKIVYLDTDDSVLVEDKLDVTISFLSPEVPPSSEVDSVAPPDDALITTDQLSPQEEQVREQEGEEAELMGVNILAEGKEATSINVEYEPPITSDVEPESTGVNNAVSVSNKEEEQQQGQDQEQSREALSESTNDKVEEVENHIPVSNEEINLPLNTEVLSAEHESTVTALAAN